MNQNADTPPNPPTEKQEHGKGEQWSNHVGGVYDSTGHRVNLEHPDVRAHIVAAVNFCNGAWSELGPEQSLVKVLKELIAYRCSSSKDDENFKIIEDLEQKLSNLRAALNKLTAEQGELRDHFDLMADEFQRIIATAKCMSDPGNNAEEFAAEIITLCERAFKVTKQKVPLIEQRDKLQADLNAAREENAKLAADLKKRGPTESWTEDDFRMWKEQCRVGDVAFQHLFVRFNGLPVPDWVTEGLPKMYHTLSEISDLRAALNKLANDAHDIFILSQTTAVEYIDFSKSCEKLAEDLKKLCGTS